MLTWHGTFTINSLAHVWGKRRYATSDDSRNNWFLALLTMGEGWHNNHHYYPNAARQGFYWWEVDVTYYGLKLLAALVTRDAAGLFGRVELKGRWTPDGSCRVAKPPPA